MLQFYQQTEAYIGKNFPTLCLVKQCQLLNVSVIQSCVHFVPVLFLVYASTFRQILGFPKRNKIQQAGHHIWDFWFNTRNWTARLVVWTTHKCTFANKTAWLIILNSNINSKHLRNLIFISYSKVASTVDATVLHHVTAVRTKTKII